MEAKTMWDKLSDYCLDISKYFLTAVFVASMVDDFGDMHWLLYLVSGILGIAFLGIGIYLNYKNKLDKNKKQRSQKRYNNKNRRK